MTWLVIVLLIIGGLIFLILELLVIPGTTVIGIIGFLLISVGIWQSFAHGVTQGAISLIITLFISIIAVYFSLKSNTWNKAMLHTSINSKVNTESQKLNIGDIGLSVSRINPSGKALFNNQYFEVSSLGHMIDENKKIEVLKINSSKVIVELYKEDEKNRNL